MSAANASMLEGIVQRQQLQIERLARETKALKEDALALHEVLVGLGILHMEAFLARLHRHRFHARMQTSNFTPSVLFDDIVSMPGLASTIGQMAPPHDMIALRWASTSMSKKIGVRGFATRGYFILGRDGTGARRLGKNPCRRRATGPGPGTGPAWALARVRPGPWPGP